MKQGLVGRGPKAALFVPNSIIFLIQISKILKYVQTINTLDIPIQIQDRNQLVRHYLIKISLTLGTFSLLQTPSDKRRSRISQEKTEGHSLLYSEMRFTTLGVATRGLDPPICRGLIIPVS